MRFVAQFPNPVSPECLIFAGPELSKFSKKLFDQNFSFLQVPTCENFQKYTLTKISHFCRSGPVKIFKTYFDQNFSFLQVRTCQNFQKCAWTKISHFCRSGPVEIYKNVILPKFLIFAGPDLSKFPKMYFDQNFIIFAGPDLSKFPKMFFDQNFSFLQVRTCRSFRKCTLKKIAHFCATGPVEISENVL